jgi:hypothetical protein
MPRLGHRPEPRLIKNPRTRPLPLELGHYDLPNRVCSDAVWGVALIGGHRLAGGHAAARRNAHGRLADASEPELRGGRSTCLTYEIGPYLARMRTEDIAAVAAKAYEVVVEA